MTLAELIALITDEVYEGRRRRWMLLRIIKTTLTGRGMQGLLTVLRLRQYCSHRGWKRFARHLQARAERTYGCYISAKATFGKGLKTPHPVGIVIGDGVVVGDRCTIYQHVTIGGARLGAAKANLYPTIGDDVTIFAGAVVVGKIRVGSDAIIGANSVVLSDVPDGATAVGIPARIIRKRSPPR